MSQRTQHLTPFTLSQAQVLIMAFELQNQGLQLLEGAYNVIIFTVGRSGKGIATMGRYGKG